MYYVPLSAIVFICTFNVIAAIELLNDGDYLSLLELILTASTQQWVIYILFLINKY